MNILYISNKIKWGGVVSWMQKTALGLQKRGHRVRIFSHKDSELTKHADENIVLIPVNLGMDYNPVMIARLVFFIWKHKIDLMVTNIAKEVIIGGIAARIAKIPNIRRVGNENDFDDLKINYFNKLIDFTIAPSRYLVNFALNKKISLNPDKISHLYNGRDTKVFSSDEKKRLKKKYNIPLDKKILGVTCQFSATKNICGILNVFAKLKRKQKIHLVLTGNGPRSEIIKMRIRELDVGKNVTLTGFVKDALEIAATYDIGILFSYLEGFSNSIVEYMAAGTPVVCTDVGGQNEIVRNDYNGFLIEAGNEEQLYDRLSLLLENETERKRLSGNCLKTIEEGFSEKMMIDKLEEIYQKCCLKI